MAQVPANRRVLSGFLTPEAAFERAREVYPRSKDYHVYQDFFTYLWDVEVSDE